MVYSINIYWLVFKDCYICYLLVHNNEPIAEWLKTTSIYYFLGQECRCGVAGCFWLHEAAYKVSAGVVSSEDLAGTTDCTFKKAHSCAAGNWQKASVSVSLHMSLSVDSISSKYSSWFPLGLSLQESKAKATLSLMS